MSISLDVNFLSTDSLSAEPAATIFDELNGLFAVNQNLSPHHQEEPNESTDVNSTTNPKDPCIHPTLATNEQDEKSCDLPPLSSSNFLLHEDQQLYVVDDEGLKPIISQFMVAGIYKKIPHYSEDKRQRSTRRNVFFSAKDRNGRIVPAEVFHKKYWNSVDTNVETVKRFPTQDMLSKLAYDVLKLSHSDNFVIDRENKEIVWLQNELRRRSIYQLLTPQTLSLTQKVVSSPDEMSNLKPKRGRPRKDQEQLNNKSKPTQSPTSMKSPDSLPTAVIRTRSGRIVKSTSNTTQETNQIKSHESDVAPESAAILMRNFLQELKDSEYVCKINSPVKAAPTSSPSVRQRKLPPDSTCPTCGKIFLGKKRMQRHFQSFPDHQPNIECQRMLEEMSLFKFLVSKIQRTSLPEDQRAEVFLGEITDLVEQLQARSSQMIRNTSGMQFVSSKTAKVLGIPEGHYALDLNAIEATPDPLIQFESIAPPPAPRIDYNLSISLDDTLTESKLNLAGTLPSEDSLLRTVDDLMKEGMKKLDQDLLDAPQAAVINYDHASDNAVEAVTMKETTQATSILDLSLDLFQFTSN